MATLKSFTDIPQSKKLAEFLPYESADMIWYGIYCGMDGQYHLLSDEYNKFGTIAINKEFCKTLFTFGDEHVDWLPCWSVAALMNLLPSEFTEKDEYSETTYKIDIRKYALTDDVDVYQIAYGNYKFYEDGHSSWKDMVNTSEKEDLLDAAFQMICWLKENKKI